MTLTVLAVDALSPSVQQVVILAAIGAAGLGVWYASRSRRPRDGGKGLSRGEVEPAAGSGGEARGDLERLVSELESLSKRIDAQVEQVGQVQRALAEANTEADRRIAALRILIEAARSVQSDSGRAGAGVTSAIGDDRSRRIHELADRGLTAVEIAQKVEQAVGEVELVLRLRATAREG